jgi:hypothetical protein
LIPTELSVIANIERTEESTDAEVELGLSKVKYWFEHVINKTIAFGRDNLTALDMLLDDDGTPRVGNIFLMAPDDPIDEILGVLFQAKMNALSGGSFVVEAIDIKSDNLAGISFTLSGDHAAHLPQTMEEWLGGPSYFSVPWWLRDDASTLDAYSMDDSEEPKRPAWAYSLDFLDKSKVGKPMETEGASVIRPDFDLRVIQGGIQPPEK